MNGGGKFSQLFGGKNILVRNFADFIMKIHHSLTFYTWNKGKKVKG